MSDGSRLRARDVMTSPVVTLRSDLSLDEAATVLSGHAIGGALVVDYADRPVGVVTREDLVRFAARGPDPDAFRKTAVAEVMSSQILTVDANALLPDVVETMSRHRAHRIFVCDAGRTAGVISSLDVLGVLAR